MAKLYVYDSYENRMLVYNNLNENDPMPYSYGSTLSVREFRGHPTRGCCGPQRAQWKRGT